VAHLELEESILNLLISNSLTDTSLFQNTEYYANVCRDFKYIDNKSIHVKQRSKSQPEVIRYSFRWNGNEYLNKRKINLAIDEKEKSLALSVHDELERLRKVSFTLQHKLDLVSITSPTFATNFENYKQVFQELASNYVQRIMDNPKDEPQPLNEQVVNSGGQAYFLYSSYVTFNGRLNFCKKTVTEDGVDVLSGVFTRRYDSNIKDLYPESIRIFRELHEFFKDSTIRIDDLCIHIIISSTAAKNKSKYNNEKVHKRLNQELENAKERLKARGIKCNVFLRIDYL